MTENRKADKKTGNKTTKEQSRREIWGVVLIALGLFFAVSLYSTAVGTVGIAVSGFFFALFGVLGYVFPVCVTALGIALIATSRKKKKSSVYILSAVCLFLVLVLIEVFAKPVVENITALQYFKEAYNAGSSAREGGGLLGALLAYPSLMYIGKVGSCIVYIAALLIIFLLVTRISLKKTGEAVGKTIKTGVDNVTELMKQSRAELYTEDLAGTSEAEKNGTSLKSRQETHVRSHAKPIDPFDLSKDVNAPVAKGVEGDIELFPKTGPIERKRSDSDDLIIDIPSNPVANIEYPAEDERTSRISVRAPLPEHSALNEDVPTHSAPAGTEYVPEEKSKEKEDPGIDISVQTPPVYQRPPYTLLSLPKPATGTAGESPQERAALIVNTFASFKISVKVINVSVGPVITRFELQPAQGVRVSRITTLSNDLALALAAPRIRIEAPIPGKSAIGIEVPNKNVAGVMLREIIENKEFLSASSPVTFALGKDIAGKVKFADLDKMPHLLIAGTTGSGKSVCINDIILSMIYKSSPEDLRMILIDPKVVELKVFSGLPHLLLPVVTDAKKAAGALKWAVMEMDQRYQKMSVCNARELSRYNSLQTDPAEKLPKLIIIIDELADLMLVAAKEVEESICRIAQLGRAAGIHLIVATQRPSADIITGLIKANIPSRIAFMVSSAVDSRVILDTGGAEKLLGKGDMLFHANGASKPVRIQCAFVSDEEVECIMEFFHDTSSQPVFDESVLHGINTSSSGSSTPQGNGKQEDELLPEAVRIVLDSGQASISMIQRRLRVGYARAARLIDIMEQMKIVSGFDGSKPRRLLITQSDYDRLFAPGAQSSEDI